MFLHVDGVTHLQGYELRLEFNNGAVRDVDLTAELHGRLFAPLRDLCVFGKCA